MRQSARENRRGAARRANRRPARIAAGSQRAVLARARRKGGRQESRADSPGWSDDDAVENCAGSADGKRLAKPASEKVGNVRRPHLGERVPHPEKGQSIQSDMIAEHRDGAVEKKRKVPSPTIDFIEFFATSMMSFVAAFVAVVNGENQ